MPCSNSIDLLGVLTKKNHSKAIEKYMDDYFKRENYYVYIPENDIKIEFIKDSIGLFGFNCFHFSSIVEDNTNLCFTVENIIPISSTSGELILKPELNILLWLPKEPITRRYDRNERIISEKRVNFECTIQSGVFTLTINKPTPGRIEFPFIIINKDIEKFMAQINSLDAIETLNVIKSTWFAYKGITSFWDFMVNGNIYDPRNEPMGKRWVCQQCAHTLYYHLDFLFKESNKRIYKLLSEMIAYSVMLSLPKDGRWMHGHWTDAMENHTRFQTDGAHLLLSYYKRTKRIIFLEKAQKAIDYLCSMAEDLADNSTWLMHDSLETDKKNFRLFYKRCFSSRAFKKSIGNTLCLNTHLWTMTALYRLMEVSHSEYYKEVFKKALRSVKLLFDQHPGNLPYNLIYSLRDLLLKISAGNNKTTTIVILKLYDKILKLAILPFLKKLFPRIYMPNGFIERDLTFAHLSDYYHIQNIYDLLIVYNQTREKWLWEIIDKAIDYTLCSNLAKHLAHSDPQAVTFLDVLLLASITDYKYLNHLKNYITFFREINIPLSVDIFSSPFVAEFFNILQTNIEKELIFGNKNC